MDRAYIDYEKFEQMTQRGVIYVTKMKQNLTYETLSSTYCMNGKGQMQWREEYVVFRKEVKAKETDENGEEKEVKRVIEHKARIVTYVDEKKHRLIRLLTNDLEMPYEDIVAICKKRWAIEFFKWLKQHLVIKKFWGTTENAVRIQIYSAICAYCIVAIVQHDMRLDRSTYEVLQILSMSLTDTTHLRDLFDKTIFKKDKDRSGSGGPNLFNF